MPVILDAQGLNKSFGAVTAAKDVSAAIEKDAVVGLIGTNGAGKTTFINMITGYLKPDTGRIHFEGRDITALAPREITRLGICRSFQIPQLYSSLSVFDNMMIGARHRAGQREARRVLLARPHLGNSASAGVWQAGGGGGRASPRPLRAFGLPRPQRAGAARRRAQAARHRAHHGGEAARAAARRADQRRLRRGEVRHHADGARCGARRRRHRAVRRARHGSGEPLRAARARVLRRPHHRRRAARGRACRIPR